MIVFTEFLLEGFHYNLSFSSAKENFSIFGWRAGVGASLNGEETEQIKLDLLFKSVHKPKSIDLDYQWTGHILESTVKNTKSWGDEDNVSGWLIHVISEYFLKFHIYSWLEWRTNKSPL